jgi:uncharacterized protein YqfA (UPF0365 family)
VAIVPENLMILMGTEIFIFSGAVILILGTYFGSLYFVPSLIVKWRAAQLGLDLTMKQSKTVARAFCNNKSFLLSVKDIWFWADIPIEKLTFHYSAKGDLANLRDGIIEMKQRKKEINFETLATFDLAGRDLNMEIKKAELNNWMFKLD